MIASCLTKKEGFISCFHSKVMLPRERGEFYYMPNPKASHTSESDIIRGWCKSPKPNKRSLLDDHPWPPILPQLPLDRCFVSRQGLEAANHLTNNVCLRLLQGTKGMVQLESQLLRLLRVALLENCCFSTEPMMTSTWATAMSIEKQRRNSRPSQINLERSLIVCRPILDPLTLQTIETKPFHDGRATHWSLRLHSV